MPDFIEKLPKFSSQMTGTRLSMCEALLLIIIERQLPKHSRLKKTMTVELDESQFIEDTKN